VASVGAKSERGGLTRAKLGQGLGQVVGEAVGVQRDQLATQLFGEPHGRAELLRRADGRDNDRIDADADTGRVVSTGIALSSADGLDRRDLKQVRIRLQVEGSRRFSVTLQVA
jgi:hypothetical protein